MSNLSLKCLVETYKLTGSNYPNWLRNLRWVLRQVNIEYVLDTPIPIVPEEKSAEYAKFDKAAYHKHLDDATSAQCVMLTSMTPELQRQYEHMGPYDMLEHMKRLYASQAQTMDYELLSDLLECRLHDGGNVSDHVLKMIGLIEQLAMIGTKLQDNVSVNLILLTLPSSFNDFIVNYNTKNTKANMYELHNMLKTYASQAQTVEYELLRDLLKCRLRDRDKVSDHIMKMIGLIEQLATTGTKLQDHVIVNIFLQSLPSSFDNFIVNYNMNNTNANMHELHNMLKTYESSTSKKEEVRNGSKSAALKPRGGVQKKPKMPKDVCLFCKEKGHWKRDCDKFKKALVTTISDN